MNTETSTLTTSTETEKPQAKAAPNARVRWFRPALDVLERADSLLLLFDLPGVSPSELTVETEQDRLTVQGVRADGVRGWRRVLTLPAAYDPSKIEAKAENGVLVLTVPKAESARPRRIEVR